MSLPWGEADDRVKDSEDRWIPTPILRGKVEAESIILEKRSKMLCLKIPPTKTLVTELGTENSSFKTDKMKVKEEICL